MSIDDLGDLAIIVKGRVWGIDLGTPRIYFQSAKHRKVFIAFGEYDGETLGSPSLNAFIEPCGQAPKWYESQKAIEIRNHQQELCAVLAACKSTTPIESAEALMDLDFFEVKPKTIQSAIAQIESGNIEEAISTLGAQAAA